VDARSSGSVPDSVIAASISAGIDLGLSEQLVDENIALEDIAHKLLANALLDLA
jgi:hypothetical protein